MMDEQTLFAVARMIALNLGSEEAQARIAKRAQGTGGRMTKPSNFRLTPATLCQLDQLAQVYNETRTGMIRRLVEAGHAAQFGPPLPAPVDGAQLVEYLLKGKGE